MLSIPGRAVRRQHARAGPAGPTGRGEPMRYLLLIAEEPPTGQPTQAEIQATMGDYNAYGTWLRERGWIVRGEALQDVTTATTVSVRDGQRIVTDGPYAETKEHLGGFYLIDVPSLDDAIEAASRIPGAATGRVEVRPILEMG
jgi:hypothetical protein